MDDPIPDVVGAQLNDYSKAGEEGPQTSPAFAARFTDKDADHAACKM